MGAIDEVHLGTETRVLLKKERKKSLASVRFSKQIAISVCGMLDAVNAMMRQATDQRFHLLQDTLLQNRIKQGAKT